MVVVIKEMNKDSIDQENGIELDKICNFLKLKNTKYNHERILSFIPKKYIYLENDIKKIKFSDLYLLKIKSNKNKFRKF